MAEIPKVLATFATPFCNAGVYRAGRQQYRRIAAPDDATLDELARTIAEGGTMTMIFGYRASWHFNLKLEEISLSDKTDRTRVVAKAGKPPDQYGREDEEDWE